MTSDEKIHSRSQEGVTKDLVAQALMDLGYPVLGTSASIGSNRPSRHYWGDGLKPNLERSLERQVGAERLSSEDVFPASRLDSRLLFISGPGTNNLVLSFFLSNTKKKYSREDVFAHLNRECEEQGISEFFVEEWSFGWDFSVSSRDVKNRSGLKMGRSTILRVVENLRRLGLLEGVANGKFRLNRGSQKVISLQHMIEGYPWNDSRDFEDFIIHTTDFRKRRKRYVHSDNFEELVRQYVSELEHFDKKNQKYFRSKLSRLSHYCDIEIDESYSSISRLIIGNKEENNWIMKIFNEKEWSKSRLMQICKNIGHEDNPALSRKSKSKLIDYIVKKSP